MTSTHLTQTGPEDGDTPAQTGMSYGGVLFDAEGRVLLREPTRHFDDYIWTFPKGRADGEESQQAAALREVREETGYRARIVGRVPGQFKGGTGSTVFFLMQPVGLPDEPDHETASVKWATPAEAVELIRQTTNAIGQPRDLAVLEAAVQAWQQR